MNEMFLAVLLACTWADSEADNLDACPVVTTVQSSYETIEQCATAGAAAVVEQLLEYPEVLHGRADRYFGRGGYQMVVDCRSRPERLSRDAWRYAL